MFETHKCNERGFAQIATFKTHIAHALREVDDLLPEGREKSIFKTKVEEAVFFGTKAIASNKENHTEVTNY